MTPFLEQQGIMILDGSLGAELTSRGYDLDDELWSAKLLFDDPQAIVDLHRAYLEAGADCLTSASYQGTFEGFARHGVSTTEAGGLLRLSVDLAIQARDDYWDEPAHRNRRLRPLVAASIGPYGAYLADGSEYTGDYGLSEADLVSFHRQRFEVLASTDANLLAIETVPSLLEARALLHLLAETSGPPAWLSFCCRDDRRLADGSDLASAAVELAGAERLAALGINCTPPHLISGLIATLRQATDKPIVIYPNSGEAYDARKKRWVALDSPLDLAGLAAQWRDAGASLIGGCCRIGPRHIRQIRDRLLGSPP